MSELPDAESRVAQDYTDRALLDGRRVDTLAKTEEGASSHATLLAGLKRANQQPSEPHDDDPFSAAISMSRIKTSKHLVNQLYCVHIRHADEDAQTKALAEERKPLPAHAGASETTRVFRDRVNRIQKVAQLLQKAQSVSSLHTLSCLGFYYDEPKLYSGLIYEYPIKESRQRLGSSMTLHEIFGTAKASVRLTLGHQFALAWTLASSLYELHKTNWMHRRISAANVVYFYDQEDDNVNDINIVNFYYVGFAQSRPVEQFSDTDGNTTDSTYGYYLHPTYQDSIDDFQPGFDYYALGVLLLEIGHGKLRPELCKEARKSIDIVVQEGFPSLVDELSYSCGREYRSSIHGCIHLNSRKRGGGLLESSEIKKKFRESVLNGLSKCKNAGI